MDAVSTQGGTVLVFGTTQDDDGSVDRVEVRVDVNGDGDFSDAIDLYNGSSFTYDGDTDDPFEDETLWYVADGTDSWSVDLNQFGELYARGDHLGDGGLTGTITIRVKAVDMYGMESLETEKVVNLDNTVPIVQSLSHQSGDYDHGTFNLTANIIDDVLGGVRNVAVSYNNGSNWTTLYNEPTSYQDASITVNSAIDLDLDLPIETDNGLSPAYVADSDVLYLVLRVTDTSNYQTLKYIYLNIDNEPPTISLKLDDPVIFNPYDITGTDAIVYGHASDTGTVSGLNQVVFYFVDASNTVYDVENGNSQVVADPSDWEAVVALNDYAVPGSEEIYGIVIDDFDEYGTDSTGGGDGDLINEYITNAVGGTDWWAEFDSFNIPDGEITICYVVEDDAGNTDSGTQPAIIANNKPNFDTTLIGDDFDNSGSVSAVEMYDYPDTGTDPVIINTLRVEVTTDVSCTFRLFYEDLTNPLTAETGTGATSWNFEETSLGTGNSYEPGNHTFLIQAWDESTRVTSIKQIDVTVVDADNTPPELQVFPLREDYEDQRATDLAGSSVTYSNWNVSDQIRPAMTVPQQDFDPDTGADDIWYQGHIELIDYTGNDSVGSEDADVSGIITLSGYVYDNYGLKAIVGTMDNFNLGYDYDLNGVGGIEAGDEEHVLAYWDATTGGLIANDLSGDADYGNDLSTVGQRFTVEEISGGDPNHFGYENQNLNQDGHILYWTLTWDTSFITGVAAEDIEIQIEGLDFYGNRSALGGSAFTNETDGYDQVDVVPYMTDIIRDAASYNTIRSRYGAYPVREGETDVTIHGYNLDSDTTGALYLSDTYTGDDNGGGAGSWDTMAITGYTVNASNTVITFDVPATANSGWVRLFVNGDETTGVEAINNYNDNSLASNDEIDPYAAIDPNALPDEWTDDRYIHVWVSGNTATDYFFNSNSPKYPAMSINPTNDLLYASWSDYGTSDTYYTSVSAGTRTSIFGCFDPSEHTDIYVDAAGNVNVGYNANYYRNTGWTASTADAGGIYLYHTNNPPAQSYGNYHRFEMLYHEQQLMQLINPRVVRNGDRLYMTWYDTDQKGLKYGSILYYSNDTTELDWIAIDGGYDGDDTSGGNAVVATGRVAAAGEYSAIDVDEDGLPVIMYYDITNQTLRLAVASVADPDETEWTLQNVFGGSDPNRTFAGKYVSMMIDSAGYLHAVFYRSSTGDLIYIKSTNNPEGGAAYTFGDSVIIDNIGSVGKWADLALDGTTPYVSYLDSSRLDTFDGLKAAFYDSSLGAGEWEYMNVPLAYDISDFRTSIEHRYQTGTQWDVAIGYVSDRYRVTYYRPEP
jgi:hypothetical protein